MLAGVALSCAVVSGGWLVRRGFVGNNPNRGDTARVFAQVFERISRDYVDTLSDSALYARAAAGLVGELQDPHSVYLTPAVLARLSERTSGEYAGIGAQIAVRDGWITIVAPLPGGPAFTAGIRPGDRITRVEGKPIRDLAVDDAQKVLRGKPGSTVHLTIARPGVSAPIEYTLTRNEIRVSSVEHASLLVDGIGYVDLSIFSQQSSADLRKAIDSLRAAGMKSLIFDLRSDPGGLLDQGIAVADLFLDSGQTVVTMKGRTPDANHTFVDGSPQPWPGLPVALLVDSGSASASEIVAGALQDHDRAVLVGAPTFGKGSAQSLFPVIGGGAVKLTTALWYTPSGRSINRVRIDGEAPPPDSAAKRPRYRTDSGHTVFGGGGITPDIIVRPPPLAPGDSLFVFMLGKQFDAFSDALTDYALSLKASGAIRSPDFVVTPEMRAGLFRLMRSRGIAIDSTTYAGASALIDRALGYEIARYVFGGAAEFARRMHSDDVVARATRLLRGVTSRQELIERASAEKKRTG